MNGAPFEEYRHLIAIAERDNPGAIERAERVASYAVATGERLGLSDEALVQLRFNAGLAGAELELSPNDLENEGTGTSFRLVSLSQTSGSVWRDDSSPTEAKIISLSREYVLCEDRAIFESELRSGRDTDVTRSFLEIIRIIQPIGF